MAQCTRAQARRRSGPAMCALLAVGSLFARAAGSQSSFLLQRVRSPPRLQLPLYMHVPTCGSSFITALVHHVCGDAIPRNVTVKDYDDFFTHYGDRCPRSLFGRDGYFGHAGIKGDTDFKTVVTMLREPVSRILSGYRNNLHDCIAMQKKYGCDDHSVHGCSGTVRVAGEHIPDPSVIDPLEYATCVENCTANMLTGYDCGAKKRSKKRSVQLETALRNIQDMAFVGLTDEWNMSICLFHAKYGGHVLASEFVDVRPGSMKRLQDDMDSKRLVELTAQATERLKVFKPVQEMQVYKAGVMRFWREIDEYKITRDECQRQVDAAFRVEPSVVSRKFE